jgi:hypothetical protein
LRLILNICQTRLAYLQLFWYLALDSFALVAESLMELIFLKGVKVCHAFIEAIQAQPVLFVDLSGLITLDAYSWNVLSIGSLIVLHILLFVTHFCQRVGVVFKEVIMIFVEEEVDVSVGKDRCVCWESLLVILVADDLILSYLIYYNVCLEKFTHEVNDDSFRLLTVGCDFLLLSTLQKLLILILVLLEG